MPITPFSAARLLLLPCGDEHFPHSSRAAGDFTLASACAAAAATPATRLGGSVDSVPSSGKRRGAVEWRDAGVLFRFRFSMALFVVALLRA